MGRVEDTLANESLCGPNGFVFDSNQVGQSEAIMAAPRGVLQSLEGATRNSSDREWRLMCP